MNLRHKRLWVQRICLISTTIVTIFSLSSLSAAPNNRITFDRISVEHGRIMSQFQGGSGHVSVSV